MGKGTPRVHYQSQFHSSLFSLFWIIVCLLASCAIGIVQFSHCSMKFCYIDLEPVSYIGTRTVAVTGLDTNEWHAWHGKFICFQNASSYQRLVFVINYRCTIVVFWKTFTSLKNNFASNKRMFLLLGLEHHTGVLRVHKSHHPAGGFRKVASGHAWAATATASRNYISYQS